MPTQTPEKQKLFARTPKRLLLGVFVVILGAATRLWRIAARLLRSDDAHVLFAYAAFRCSHSDHTAPQSGGLQSVFGGLFARTRVRARGQFVFRGVMVVALAVLVVGVVAVPRKTEAATADTVNFQAKLMTAAGAIAPDGNYNVEFNLYNTSTGGSSLWTEDYLNSNSQAVRVVNGYLTVNLGSITPFPSINWDQNLYVGMTVRGTANCAFGSCTPADGEMTPRLKLTAVPYAFSAGNLSFVNQATGFKSTLVFQGATSQDQTITIPDDPTNATDQVCLRSRANCTGTGGSILGSGVQNFVAKFDTGAGNSIGSSSIFDNGSFVGINNSTTNSGLLSVQGASTSQSSIFVQAAASATVPTVVINQAASQTGNLFQLVDNSGNINGAFNSTGNQLSLGKVTAGSGASLGKVVLGDGTIDNISLTLESDVLTGAAGNLTVTLPKPTTGTAAVVCYQGDTACGFATAGGSTFIKNQLTQQVAANFNIDGSGTAGTSLLTPLLDTPSGTTVLNVGTTNATGGVNLNQNTTVASGKTLTVTSGATTLTGASNGTALSVTATGTTGIAAILQGGDVGVGTATPGAALDVSGSASKTGTGTLTTSGTTTVTGTGTHFTTELNVGDTITASGQTLTVVAIASDTSLTTSNVFSPSLSGASFTHFQSTERITSAATQNGLILQGSSSSFFINALSTTGIQEFQVFGSGNVVANGYIRSQNGSFQSYGNAATFQSGDLNSGFSSATVTVRSGNATGAANSGNVTVSSGTAANGNTGNVIIDSGVATGGTAGTITIGTTNASAVTIGRSAITTSLAGTIVLSNPVAASNNVAVCLNASNQLAGCNNTFEATNGTDFIKNQSASAQAGNFYVQNSGTTTTNTAVIEQSTSQTGELLQFQNSSGARLAGFTAAGHLGLNAAATTAELSIIADATTTIGNIVRGQTGQTADLVQLQGSNGLVLSGFNGTGGIYTNGQANTLSGLTFPTGIVLGNVGTGGATNYYYRVSSVNTQGETIASAEQTETGNATLNSTNYNTVTFNGAPGATSYNIYRSTVSGSELKIGSVTGGSATTYVYNDQTSAVGGGALPTGAALGSILTLNANQAPSGNILFKVLQTTGATGLSIANAGQLFGNAGINAANSGAGAGISALSVTNSLTSTVAANIQGASGQTADLLQYRNTNGAVLSGINANGGFYTNGTNSTFAGLATPVITSPSTTGTNFYYVVTATNAAGETIPSNVLAMNANTSVINWTQVPGATGYNIYRNTTNSFTGGSLLLVTITNGTTVTYTDSGSATIAGLPPTSVTGTGLTLQGWSGQSTNVLTALSSTGNPIFGVNASGNGLVFISTTSSYGGRLSVGTQGTGTVGVAIRGVSGQTADLFQLQDSNGIVQSKFNSSGQLTLGVPATSGTVYQGSLTFADGTTDGFGATLNTTTLTANQTISLPNESGTICIQTSVNCGFAAASGSANYIQNSTTTQTANFNVQSASASSVAAVIQGAASQTADLLQVRNSTPLTVLDVNAAGDVYATQRLSVASTDLAAAINAKLAVAPGAATTTGVVIQGFTAQTANLLQLQDSNANTLVKVDANGNLNTQGTTVTLGALLVPTGVSAVLASGGSLAVGTTYYYEVSAVNSGGETTANSAVSVTPTSGNQTVNLTWTASPGATSYKIFRDTSTAFSGSTLLIGTTTGAASFSDTGLTAATGTPQTSSTVGSGLIVRSTTNAASFTVDRFGLATAANSLRVSGGAAVCSGGVQALCVTAGNSGSVATIIRGAASQSADLLQLQDVNGAFLSGVDANGDPYTNGVSNTFNGLARPVITSPSTTGTNFYYVATATNAAGETIASNTLAMNANTSVINWTQVPGATGYKIYRNTTNGFTSGSLLLKTITNGTTVTYTDTGSATIAGLPPTAVTGTGLTIQGWSGQTGALQSFYSPTAATYTNFNSNGFLQVGVLSSTALVGGEIGVRSTTGGRDLVLAANASQISNIAEIQNASGDVLSKFTATGQLVLGTIGAVAGAAIQGSVGFGDGTTDGFAATLNTSTLTANQTISLPNASGTICLQSSAACGFAATTGGTGYIQNGTTTQTANFNIQSASASGVAATIQGAAGQTANLLQLQDSNGNILSGINAGGALFTNGTANVLNGLVYPSGVTLATVGTAGSTTYYYRVSSVGAQGETIASTETSIATGNTTLSGTNYNTVTFNSASGASSYNIYRSTVSGNELKIGSVTSTNAATYTYNDQTSAAGSGALPTGSVNSVLTINGGSGAPSAGTLVVNNASGNPLVQVGINGGSTTYIKGSLSLANTYNTGSPALQLVNSGASTVAAYIQGASSQTADLLQYKNSNSVGVVLSGVNANGGLYTNGVSSSFNALAVPTLSLASGGGTAYYYEITAVNAAGQTIASNEVSTNGTSGVISWPVSPGATSYQVYRGTAAGAENVYTSTLAVSIPCPAGATTCNWGVDASGGFFTASGTPPTNTAGSGLKIQGWSGQTGNLLQFKDGSANILGGFNAAGNLYYGNSGFTTTLNTTTLTANQTIALPNASGTVCLQASSSCGFEATNGTDFIQNQSASAQTANLNIQSASGTSVAAVIQGAAGGSADVLQIYNLSGTKSVNVSSAGRAFFSNGLNVGTSVAGSGSGYGALLSGNTGGSGSAVIVGVRGIAGQTGDLIQNQDANGNVLSGFNANGGIYANGAANTLFGLSSPATVSLSTSGTAGSTTYAYRVSALNSQGETIPATEVSIATGNATLSGSNFVTVTWSPVAGATSYKVYGRTASGELFMATLTGDGRAGNYTFNDTGTITPSGALPTGSVFGATLTVGGSNGASATVFNVQSGGGNTLFSVGLGNQTTIGGGLVLKNANNTAFSALQLQNQLGTTVAAYIQGAASQSADLLQYTDAHGAVLSGVTSNGGFYTNGVSSSFNALAVPAFTTTSTGTSYYYEITATNAAGETVGSTSLGMANNTSALTWNQVPGATGYKIYRNTSNSFTSGSLLRTTLTSGSTVSFTDTGAITSAGLPPTSVTGTGLTLQSWSGQTGDILSANAQSGARILTVGNGSYVRGFVSVGTSANLSARFNVSTAGSATVGEIIQGIAGQTGDLLELQNSSSNVLSSFSASGQLTLGNNTVSGTTQGSINFADGAADGFAATISTTTLTANQTISLPNESGTICLQTSVNCGFAAASGSANYIQNQSAGNQTANFNIVSASSTTVAAVIQAATGSSVDVLDIRNAAGFNNAVFTGGQFNVARISVGNGGNGSNISSIGSTARLEVLSNGSGTAGGGIVVRNTGGGTADLYQNQDNNVNLLSGFNASGALYTNGTTNTINGLIFPATVTLGTVGTAGSTTYYYRVSSVNAAGETKAGTEVSIATGNATLSGTNYDTVTFSSVPGAASYNIYRSTVSGSELKIGSVTSTGSTGNYVYNDQTSAAGSGALPAGTVATPLLAIGGNGSANSNPSQLLLSVAGVGGNVTYVDSNGFLGSKSISLLNSVGNTQSLLKVTNNAPTVVAAYLQGASTQSADLLQNKDANGAVLSGITNNGGLYTSGVSNTFGNLATPVITSPSTTGTNFYYIVTATNAAGETIASNVLALNTNTSIINWTQVPGATGYKIYRNTTSTFGSGLLLLATITNGTTVTYTDTGSAATAGLPPTAPTGTGITIQGWAGQTSALESLTSSAGSGIALQTQVAGDTAPRLSISANGQLNFGSGSGSSDVQISRTGSSTLTVWGHLSVGAQNAAGTQLYVAPSAAGGIGQIIRGQSGQTADLFQLQNSSGDVLAKHTANGQLVLGTIGAVTGSSVAGSIGFGDGTTDGFVTSITSAVQSNNVTLTIPADANSTDTLCLATLNNCLAVGTPGGDLTGSYPAPTIAKLQGKTLTISTTPSTGSVLQYNGSAFVDGFITNTNLQAGTFGNITGTGALAAGSITSGFGTISTGNNITTTATVQGNVVNATGAGEALELGGANINTAGTLSNVAYLNQANTFSAAGNIFSGAGTALTVNNNATISGTGTIGALNVTNGATVGNGLTVTAGASSFGGNVSIAGTNTLTVNTGATTLGGQLNANGGIVTNNANVNAGTGTITSGNINGQAISSAANFTGTVTIQGSGGLTLGIAGPTGTTGQLTFANAANTNTVSLATAAQGNAVVLSIPTDTNTTDTVCLQTLNNCAPINGISGTGTTNYVARFTASNTIGNGILYDDGTFAGVNATTQISNGTLSVLAAASKVGLSVQGSGGDIADFVANGGGTPVASIDANGSLTVTGGNFTKTSVANASAVSIAQNNAATSGTVANNGLNIALTGAATSGANTNSGINFSDVTVNSGNSFVGLNFSASNNYASILSVGANNIISGAGLLQNNAIDSTLTYSNLQKVGALNAGSITAFGTIATGNTISGTVLTGTTAVATPAIRPTADSTAAIEIQNAAGTTNIFSVDTTNNRVGINNVAPGYSLDVTGDINTTANLRTSGTIRLDNSGNLSNIGSITSAGTAQINVSGTAATSIGNTTGTLALQGNASSTIGASNGTFATTIDFANPTANVTLHVPTLAAGSYTICTDSGNCNGAGSTLQTGYNNSAGGSTPEITLDAAHTSVDIQAYSGQTDDLLDLRAYTATGLGAIQFGVSPAGVATVAGGLTVQAGGVNVTGTSSFTGNVGVTGSSTLTGATTITGATNINNSGSATTTIGNASAGAIGLQSAGAINTTAGADSTISTSASHTLAIISKDFNVTAAGGLSLGSTSNTGIISVSNNSATTTLNVATSATPTTAVIVGTDTTNTSTDKLLSLQSGSTPTAKFTVDAAGNVVALGGATAGTTGQFQVNGSNGNVSTTGTLTYADSGAAATATVCKDGSGLLTACSTTGTGATFVQGGNLFGAAAELGTNDANALNFRTNNTDRLTLNATGSNFTFLQAATINTNGALALGIDTGGAAALNIGNANTNALTIGNTSASFTAEANATVNLFNGATAHTVQLATGAATQTVTIGSTNSSSSLALQGGAYSVNVGNTGVGIKATAPTTGSVDLFFGAGSNRLVNINQEAAATTGDNLTIQAGKSGSGAVNGGNLILQAGATGGSGVTGSVIVRANGSDTTGVFQIQDSSSSPILTVDSSTRNINYTPNNTGTLGITSDLTNGARSTYALNITQANNATNNNSVGLLQLSNADTASTAALESITQVGGGTGLSIATGITTGTGISISSSFSSGKGINLTNASAITSGNGIVLNGSNSSGLTGFTGSQILVNPTRTNTATSGTVTDSGNFLNLTRSNTQNGAGGTYAITGALANLQSTCAQTAGTCTDSANIINLNQQYASASGAVLNASNSGTGSVINLTQSGALGAGNAVINVNDTNSTSDKLLNLQKSASSVFTVNALGVTTLAGGQTADITTSGATTLKLDTGAGAAITLGGTNATQINIGHGTIATAITGNVGITNTNATTTLNVSSNTTPTTALIVGTDTTNTSTDKLLSLQSGSTPTAKFTVDAAGNVVALGSATISGTAQAQNFDAVAAGTLGLGNLGGTTGTATNILLGNNAATTKIQSTSTTIQASAGTAVQSTTDNSTAFTVQNSAGASLISIDSTNTAGGLNIATNGGAETGTTSWSALGSATVTQDTTGGEYASGTAGIKAATTGTNQGARYNLTLTSGSTYNVSFSVKSSSGSPTLSVFYSTDGATSAAACAAGSYDSASIASKFVKYTCKFTATSSASAYVIIAQTDSTTRSLFIDNLSVVAQGTTTQNTGVVKVGGAASQGLTLFQLDAAAGTPFTGANASLAGAMYFDTTQGKMQCYDGTVWGACGAAPNSNITLTPEYAGAVLNGTGIGTLTSDFCANQASVLVVPATGNICNSGDARNFYKWTSVQPSSQGYSVYVTYKLPSTFKQFVLGSTSLTGRVDNTTNASVGYSIFKSTGGAVSACGSAIAVTSTTNTWQTVSPTSPNDLSTCGFTANNYVIFKIDVTASNSASAFIENLNFNYTNQ
jgi:hypothetical protein